MNGSDVNCCKLELPWHRRLIEKEDVEEIMKYQDLFELRD